MFKQLISVLALFLISLNTLGFCDSHKKCERKLYNKNNFLTYYSSEDLEAVNTKIERVVIVVHGALRNGHEYFDHVAAAAKKFNVHENTLVIAPTFRKITDPRLKNEHFWGRRWYTKWKYGYVSEDSDQISSFTILDNLILKVSKSNNFRNLKSIVVTGHSAGGQFSQRYAVGTQIRNEINQNISFVPSNPSSYMYLHPERFQFSDGNFQVMNLPTNCEAYDEYIYGLKNRAAYLNKYSAEELRENFRANNVTYLMSEEDKGTDSLDRSCEAMIQGKTRIERAMNFYHYDKNMIGNHNFVSIPAIGHDHVLVYESKESAEHVFGIKTKKNTNFIYRKVGDVSNKNIKTNELFLLLGGGANETNGFQAFLKAANGGDVVVISTKAALNHRYTFDLWMMAQKANIKIDSVETVSLLNVMASNEEFILSKVRDADAIFFTGGDQSRYINRIKGTKLHDLLISKVQKGMPIGGTSAGLAIMGEYIFSAKRGGVSSEYVLKNPLTKYITIENDFFNSSTLEDLITDTHFMNRDREGRLLGFMYRTQSEYKAKNLFGLGIDEKSSVLLTSSSMKTYGGVYLYKSLINLVNDNQGSGLNYGPVLKLKLNPDISYPHYKDISFQRANSLKVIEGQMY